MQESSFASPRAVNCLCCRLHEQLNESDDAAQCYMLYIQDIFSCGVSRRPPLFMTNLQLVHRSGSGWNKMLGVYFPFLQDVLISGATGACRGEHSSAVPGSVLFQKQALRRGVSLRSAVLRLQRRKYARFPTVSRCGAVETLLTVTVCRPEKRGRPCWGRSRRLEIKLKHPPQICLHRSPTTTLQSGGCLHSTSSLLHPDIHLFLLTCCKMDICLHHVT